MHDDLEQPRTDESWDELGRLDRFFDGPDGDVPSGSRDLIQPLLDYRQVLYHPGYRVAFVGVPKAGKSSLINALLGIPLLPVSATRSTCVVTLIEYGAELDATRVRKECGETGREPLPLDALQDVIQCEGPGSGREIEVRIRVPHPLLEGRCVLIDTPGLREGRRTMARIEAELARSDLVVMVLSVDKVLSSLERRVVRRIDHLLNGNIVFVLNRLDLIEEDDWREVLDWASAALRDSGNKIVGNPRLFATVARPSAGGTGEDLPILRGWLAQLLSGPVGARVAAISRLGGLEERIRETSEALRASFTEAQKLTRQVREDEEAALVRDRAQHKERIIRARGELVACKAALEELGNAFVRTCVEDTWLGVASVRSSTIPVAHELALERYRSDVESRVRGAAADAAVTAPPFNLGYWIFRTSVEATGHHPVSDIGETLGSLVDRVVDGRSAGRDAGSSLGGWFDKNVLGVDAEAETRRRIDALVRPVLPSLRSEAERYIDGVGALLVQAGTFYNAWTRASPRVTAAETEERAHEALLRWCDQFLQEVRALVGLQLEGRA